MVREFERKLRLTAALIGANTRKDLARAFQRVNRATSFDIDRRPSGCRVALIRATFPSTRTGPPSCSSTGRWRGCSSASCRSSWTS